MEIASNLAAPDIVATEFRNSPQPIGVAQDPTSAYWQYDHVNSQDLDRMTPTAHISRLSVVSLIDLDASLAIDTTDASRPSTAGSDAASTSSDLKTPFDLERHAVDTNSAPRTRESSVYLNEDLYPSSPPRTHDSPSPPHTITLDLAPDPSCPAPAPPSAALMQVCASPEETKDELCRMITSKFSRATSVDRPGPKNDIRPFQGSLECADSYPISMARVH